MALGRLVTRALISQAEELSRKGQIDSAQDSTTRKLTDW
jgi:hypothetical protein